MTCLAFKEFDRVYQQCVDDIWRCWNSDMQTQIAKHCVAWAPGRIDFEAYLRLSSIRFYKAYQLLHAGGAQTLCDIGGFWGVWPMAAKRLGYEVAMTESLRFYGSSFDRLFDEIRKGGVEIFDHDPFEDGSRLSRQFDFVNVMAVLEHYPHSLRTFVENVKGMISDSGKIFFEVPNIAYWPKRTALLRGISPLPAIQDIYLSDEPFIGHHHEFTMTELRELARLGGLEVVAEKYFNYTLSSANPVKLILRYPAMSAAFWLSKESRECIAVLCQKQKG